MINVPENFYRSTISQDWPTGTGNFYVVTKPTITQGYMTISPASNTLREIVFFTATGTDGTGDYVTISDAAHRGIGGTTEQTHIIGEPVRINVGAETIQEIVDNTAGVTSGSGAPASTPSKIGDLYVDTTNSKLYASKGTSSSADWFLTN
jgi:hypothetical protein